MMPILLSTALVLVAGSAAATGSTMLVPSTMNGGLYFSEHNWAMETSGAGPVAVSVNSGAYIKAMFSGSVRASFALEATKPSTEAEATSTHYMNVVYSIDNKPWVEVPIFGNTTEIVIPYAEVNATITHTLQLQIYNSLQGANRWNSPATGGAALVVKGLTLDGGAKVLPPALLPRRAIFFGDSITEGVNAECRNTPETVAAEGGGVARVPGDVPEPGGDLSANSATKTWGPTVAAALRAEYSQVGFGSLGWVVSGAGGVPAFYVPGQESVNSWNKHYNTANRSFDNLDYIFVGHATNDGLREGSKATAAVTAAVTGWLGGARAAAGPKTAIFLCVPFGSFGAANEPKGSLKAGFDAYQAKNEDPHTYFIDLGRDAAIGLECGSWERGCVGAFGSQAGGSMQGCDGIHPRGGTHAAARHGELGAMLATQAVLAMAGHTL
jgi:hypothetical protein